LVNLETMAVEGAPLDLRSNPELGPWLKELTARHAAFLPHGSTTSTPVSSWNDQWPFAVAGIPNVKIGTYSDDYDRLYHTDFETSALVDWDYLAKVAKLVFRAVERLDDGLLPYSLKARADHLAAAVNQDELLAAGADAAVVSRLAAGVAAFRKAAAGFELTSAALPSGAIEPTNSSLLEIEKAINAGFTALSPADDDATVYPHQPVLGDARGIGAALAALRASTPDKAAALKALAGTYLTRHGIAFSYPVYLKHIARLDPGFDRITFAAQGRLPAPLDVMPQYRRIEAGDYAGAVAELEASRRALLADLDHRLTGMADLLEQVTPRIERLAEGR
jgi:hypothetical protein